MVFYKSNPKKTIIRQNYIAHNFQEIYVLTKRLYIQLYRRPATIISGIIQPLLWLVLFGALFQNAPVDPLNTNIKYSYFLSPGIIVFTAFNGAINAGLPLIFDREFGFLNRLLVAPLQSRDCLLVSLIIFILTTTILQTSFIIFCSCIIFQYTTKLINLFAIQMVILITTLSIANLSIYLAFTLPGHIEFLAIILIINLPTLFSSTALAPLSFMPYWLQIIASLNPLTYAIENVRKIYFIEYTEMSSQILQSLTCKNNIQILLIAICISILLVKHIISYKFE